MNTLLAGLFWVWNLVVSKNFSSQKDHAARLLKFELSRTQATDKNNTHLCTHTYSGIE
jgi:hypothetical protein